MKPTSQQLRPLLEAILFLYGDVGIKSEDLSHILTTAKPSQIEAELKALANEYQNSQSGLMIQQFNKNHFRLCVKPEFISQLGPLNTATTEIKLSPTMIEVATIIAYKGPMTRGELEQFRGTDSSFVLNKLRDLNLIEQQGYKPESRAHLYAVTPEFFKVFNLENGARSLIPLAPHELEIDSQTAVAPDNPNLFEHHDDSNY